MRVIFSDSREPAAQIFEADNAARLNGFETIDPARAVADLTEAIRRRYRMPVGDARAIARAVLLGARVQFAAKIGNTSHFASVAAFDGIDVALPTPRRAI